MIKFAKYIIIFELLIISLLFLPSSFSEELELRLIEGGCVGYENALLDLYYENESVVNSSEYEVIIYNGPIAGLGILDTFTADSTPYNVLFDEENDYLYEIETYNNSIYTGLEGRITIYECAGSDNEDSNLIEVELEFEPKISITFLSNSTDTTNYIFQLIDAPNNLLQNELEAEYGENNFDIKYYNLDYEGGDVVKNLSLQSELNISLFNETQDEWIKLEDVEYNISFPTLFAVKNISLSIDDSNGSEDTEVNSSKSLETSNSQVNSNNANSPNSQNFIEDDNNGNLLLYLIIGVVLIVALVIITIISISISNSKKNKEVVDKAPLTLTETKIMTYCDNYKHKYEPKEIVEQLVEQGYDKQIIINTLWKYVKKEKHHK